MFTNFGVLMRANIRNIVFSGLCLTLLTFCSQKKAEQPTSQESVTSGDAITFQQSEDKKVILFFGNSITAGYQLDTEEAFPALIQRRLDSLNYPYMAINAG